MTELQIIKCVPCPEHWDKLMSIEYCDGCEYRDPFKSIGDRVECTYGEGEEE